VFTWCPAKSGKGGGFKHYSANDYYSKHEQIEGHWVGKGSDLVGLHGAVTEKDFDRMQRCEDPVTGEFMRQKKSVLKKDIDGNVTGKPNTYVDFTCSADKSVSLFWRFGFEEGFREDHRDSVTNTLGYMEKMAQTRVRIEGQDANRTTGNLIIARYEHTSSVRLDPQMHDHCVVFNMTRDPVEHRFKALQRYDLCKMTELWTEIYRNDMAWKALERGYEVSRRIDEKGKDAGMKVGNLSPELEEFFSKGSREKMEGIKAFEATRKRAPTKNEIKVIVNKSRPATLEHKTDEEVYQIQFDQLTDKFRQEIAAERAKARSTTVERSFQNSLHALDMATEHCFSTHSAVPEWKLMAETLKAGRGRVTVEHIQTAIEVRKAEGHLLGADGVVTTAKHLAQETECIAIIDSGVGKYKPFGRRFPTKAEMEGHPLSEKERECADAIESALNSRDLAHNIKGAAGAGKTTLLEDFRWQLAQNNQAAFFMAPTHKAVEELRKIGAHDAITVDKLLTNAEHQAFARGKLLVVDEAGLLSNDHGIQLLRFVRDNQCRLQYVGDTKQLQSVSAGDHLRILENHSRLQHNCAELKQVVRQTDPDYKAAVELLREEPVAGFNRFCDMGKVFECDFLDMPQIVAKAYLNAKGSKLLISPRWDDIHRITDDLRAMMKEREMLGKSVKVDLYENLNISRAYKQDMSNLQKGMTIVLHTDCELGARGQAFEIQSGTKGSAMAKDANGKEITLTALHANLYDACAKKAIEVCEGEELMMTQASKGHDRFRCDAGQRMTVDKIDASGHITFKDGQVMPKDFKMFNYGYATTVHRAQGQTVDSAILAGDWWNRESFYVGASRGREHIEIYTSSEDRMRLSVAETAARQSATELQQRMMAVQLGEMHQFWTSNHGRAHSNQARPSVMAQHGPAAQAQSQAQEASASR